MLKINYIKPNEGESPDDIAIYNLKICDKYKNLQAFCQSTVSWLKNDPSRDYQDLELLLRHLELDTHLIARPKESMESNENFVLSIPNRTNDTNVYDYILWVSCKSKDKAIEELLTFHNSYEENFECLSRTGCLINKNLEVDIKETTISYNETDAYKKILSCELKYDFVEVDKVQSLNIIIKDIIEKKGKEPQKVLYGKYGESNIYALVIDGQIVSPIGWIEYSENNIELIDFRTLKKM